MIRITRNKPQFIWVMFQFSFYYSHDDILEKFRNEN